jgi:hypothetical protein
MNVIHGPAATLVESHRCFCEVLLAQSAATRHQDRLYLEDVVPTLRTYDEQVGAAKTLTLFASRRSKNTLLAVDAALCVCALSETPCGELSPASLDELAHLRQAFGPEAPPIDEESFTLRDLGWTPQWRDPSPNCVVFQNSVYVVEEADDPLSIFELLEYGLVPSDLDEFNQGLMRDAGLITEESDALLAEYNGDWRAMLRDDSLAGSHLC